jgi:hypothetical protein
VPARRALFLALVAVPVATGLAGLDIVVFTGLAGALFAVLRQTGGGAPFLLHWAATGIGVVASAWAWRQDRSPDTSSR